MSITQNYITTRGGNTLSIFYNPENDLLVVDLMHKNERGGNEIVRTTLNEEKLLKGIDKLPPIEEEVDGL
jgi:hypothetical protein